MSCVAKLLLVLMLCRKLFAYKVNDIKFLLSSTKMSSSQIKEPIKKFHECLPNQVIFLAGCTSVGKSAVAKELSRVLDAEIVSADSVQIYKYLDIGLKNINYLEYNMIA
jgi:hypothetical protein